MCLQYLLRDLPGEKSVKTMFSSKQIILMSAMILAIHVKIGRSMHIDPYSKSNSSKSTFKNIIHSITAGDMLLWYRDLLDPYQKNEALLLEENGQSVTIDEDLVVYGPIRFQEESNIRLYWNKYKINHKTYIFFLKLHSTYKLCALCDVNLQFHHNLKGCVKTIIKVPFPRSKQRQKKSERIFRRIFGKVWAKWKTMSDVDTLSIVIKWAAKEYPIDNVPLTNTVQDLKNAIHAKTNVLPARQKLLNLRFKGKAPSDEQCLSSLSKF